MCQALAGSTLPAAPVTVAVATVPSTRSAAAVDWLELRAGATGNLHSRKLRSFQEVAFQ